MDRERKERGRGREREERRVDQGRWTERAGKGGMASATGRDGYLFIPPSLTACLSRCQHCMRRQLAPSQLAPHACPPLPPYRPLPFIHVGPR